MALLLVLVAAVGLVIGVAGASASPVLHGPFVLTDLSTLGGTTSVPTGVTENGQVIGQSTTAGDAEDHGFAWTPTAGMVDRDRLAHWGAGRNLSAPERLCCIAGP